MTRRHDPEKRFPRRPRARVTGCEEMPAIEWDMLSVWMTAAEWLAWVRRRDGRKTLWDGTRWRYPIRPQIAASVLGRVMRPGRLK